ncbi:MAG: hypothetical protein HYX34_05860 [Actinobacteria bacterium]|nr:hypothetical protein [Actinomycetota bacterium]
MSRRWAAVVIFASLVAAAVALDRGQPALDRRAKVRAGALAGGPDLAGFGPTAAPAGSLDSVWYCAGSTATAGGAANATLVVSNPGARPVTGRIIVVPSRGATRSQPLIVGPRGRVDVRLTDIVDAPYAAATVQLAGGEAIVERAVRGPDGYDVASCASSASDTWFFASGATTRDARETLLLYNPFPDAAVADLSFATVDGTRRPEALQGVPVPGGSVVAADVSAQVTVRAMVSAVVRTRTGRLVVDRIQTFDGTGAATTEAEATREPFRRRGVTLAPGVPSPRPTWAFPMGAKRSGVHERYVVYNPDPASVAKVDLAITLDDPQRNGQLYPFRLDVGPGSFQVLDLDREPRVPAGIGHSAVVSSDRPVVAERLIDTVDPFSSADSASSSGASVMAPTWVVGAGSVTRRVDERLMLLNPGPRAVRVRLRAYGGGRLRDIGVPDTVVRAGEHRLLSLRGKLDERVVSVLLRGDGPFVAERWVLARGDAGNGTALGVPLAAGLEAIARSGG